jgi:hypothetical protein
VTEQKKHYLMNKWIEGPFRLSHHPLCSPFGNHTLNLFNRDICRGCLFWYPGIVIGIVLGFLSGIHYVNEWILVVPMFFLVVPTLLSVVFNPPRRFKDFSRGLLGLATGFAILIVFMPGPQLWYVRIIVLGVFLIIFGPLTIVRNDRNEAVCHSCPEYPKRGQLKCSGFKTLRERQIIADSYNILGISDAREQVVTSFDEI